jgi:hypothetical protein
MYDFCITNFLEKKEYSDGIFRPADEVVEKMKFDSNYLPMINHLINH